MDIASISVLVGTSAGLLGKIVEAVKSKKYNELNTLDIIGLKDEILSLQPALYELQQENQNLKDEIKKLRDNKELENEFEYLADKDYIIHKKGGSKRKLCTTCWNSKEQKYSTISMHPSNRFLECRICKSRYEE